ncbi:MAG: hypothetical protein GY746_08970 [Gammaproteobacteria bacterium]|nr:hypothetical protein [Gammaproteobacteria bacterium]
MGLVNQAQPQPQAPTGGMVPTEEPTAQAEEELTPEEEGAYTAAMEMVAELIYVDDTANKSIMNQLKANEPAAAIAETTVFIIDQVEQAFNGQLPEGIILPLADEISDLLLELLQEDGGVEIDQATYTQAKGAVTQELIDAYGIEEADMEGMLQGVTADEVKGIQAEFEGGAQ